MRVLFYLGWVLMFLAFIGAAGEAIPRSLPSGAEGRGWFISAYDLWYAAKPGSLVVAQIQVEKISPALWDPIIVALLALPVWLLFGGPGVLLAWFFRPYREITAEQREDLQKQEESLLLFDKLSEEARAAGYDEDDREPNHGGYESMEILEAEGGAAPYSEEQALDHLELDEGGGEGGGEER